LLKIDPHIKGIHSAPWFADPKIEEISPRLRWVRQTIVGKNGPSMFYVGTSENCIKDATFKSPTRRRLYNEGLYMPAKYLYVWPRNRLIKWADANRI